MVREINEDDETYEVPAFVRTMNCVQGMKKIPTGSVDVVVTSPPYNLGKKYGKYMDRRDQKEYLNWCQQWAIQVRRVLKENGSFFLNLGSRNMANTWTAGIKRNI